MVELPRSLKAEQTVLAYILSDQSGKETARVIDLLGDQDLFCSPINKKIYQICLKLYGEGKIPYGDLVLEVLKDKNQLNTDDEKYIIDLSRIYPLPSSMETQAKILREKTAYRELIKVCYNSLEALTNPYENRFEEVAGKLQEEIYNIKENSISEKTVFSLNETASQLFKEIQRRENTKRSTLGLDTGYSKLNTIINGFLPKKLYILAARPAVGKTSLALNMALNVAKAQKKNIFFFSLEMDREELTERFLASISGINSQVLKSSYILPEIKTIIESKREQLEKLPIIIDDKPGLSISDLRTKIKAYSLYFGEPSLIIIDYLQLLCCKKRTHSRQEEVASISRALKEMTKEFKAPILALAQLNRALEARRDKRPVLADLRESGSLEQEADVVMMIYRDFHSDKPEEAELTIVKHRSGGMGTINLTFDAGSTTFKEDYLPRVKNEGEREWNRINTMD